MSFNQGPNGAYEPGVERQFRVQDTALYRELLQEQLQTVATVNVVDENDTFAFDELHFQDDVCQKKFINLVAPRTTRQRAVEKDEKC